ncbi:MAG: chemotaxis protein CheC [Solirubrobacteraceae bacterium]|jgi:chemotaxis protein CheC|nr:chemotaxis protein CheC [Solirubrobacteraceae bacterium]
MTRYSEQQLDALGELANIGSGTAGTALSTMIGRAVDISVPSVRAMDIADAVDAAGEAGREVRATLIPIKGDLAGSALLIFPPEDAAALCRMLGTDPDGEEGASALAEIGNILCSTYLSALAQMLGMQLEPCPPETAWDLLGAIVASVLLAQGETEEALVLDSELHVEGASCGLSFMLLPSGQGVGDLLRRLGL